MGEGYIKNNKEAIISSLYAITTETNYEKELKELVYTETILYGSYKKYIGMFLDFYKEKLNDEERLSENKALSLNKELLPFLKEHIQPHTLDLIRALKDLRKVY